MWGFWFKVRKVKGFVAKIRESETVPLFRLQSLTEKERVGRSSSANYQGHSERSSTLGFRVNDVSVAFRFA